MKNQTVKRQILKFKEKKLLVSVIGTWHTIPLKSRVLKEISVLKALSDLGQSS